jgi:hypothetical protein
VLPPAGESCDAILTRRQRNRQATSGIVIVAEQDVRQIEFLLRSEAWSKRVELN